MEWDPLRHIWSRLEPAPAPHFWASFYYCGPSRPYCTSVHPSLATCQPCVDAYVAANGPWTERYVYDDEGIQVRAPAEPLRLFAEGQR